MRATTPWMCRLLVGLHAVRRLKGNNVNSVEIILFARVLTREGRSVPVVTFVEFIEPPLSCRAY
jgi:hypothetical protein